MLIMSLLIFIFLPLRKLKNKLTMYRIFYFIVVAIAFCLNSPLQAQNNASDRQFTTDLAYKISEPVLRNMAKGELKKNMQIEVSPNWDGRDKGVTYMEAFGRLMAGIAPWLNLPDDDTAEGKQRKQLREWALKSYAHAVDPDSPDYLLWRKEGQPLVDAAFIAQSFIRAPERLWEPLDDLTKQRYIEEFTLLRRVDPPYNNWLLFSATIEAFLMSIDAPYDAYRIHSALRKTNEWYVGDGFYADGEHFRFDYYNSFVIQPMYLEVLEICINKRTIAKQDELDIAKARIQRYSTILERLISPEASFPAFGRSITYRSGAFHALALISWKEMLPKELTEGQVRNGLTSVMRRMFSHENNFNQKGFLQLGFVGHQPELSDGYTNNGSLYLTSFSLLPLGLPANHSFWTTPAEDWTAKKAWSEQPFPKDGAMKE